jgi:transforming growth factor-beta-induced protein
MNKHRQKLKMAVSFLMLASLLLGCSSSDGNGFRSQREDIVDTAIEADNLNTLVAALQAAGLDETLRGPGPFTVFAPTDEAFAAIPSEVLNQLISAENKAPLRDILLYHVYDGEVRAAQAEDLARNSESVVMLNGDVITLDLDGGDIVLNSNGGSPATIITADILASNGVIHVIDAVLNPSDGKGNIIEKLVNLGNYTTLIAAVQAADLEAALSGPGPLTLFAPTDEAFAKIPDATLNALLSDIPTLTDILTYHVIAAEIFAVNALAADGTAITMLNGDDVTVDLVDSALTLNASGGSPAIVTATDFIATNGIIHAIDTVLDPNDAPMVIEE